ncbi:MAG TPA: SIS domain-containing protein [Opitutaceae bacterium]|jgi:D-sedoheptulose 7-phosphate isomerase|nr:SIS domain-containing protein [Opitutaceae bacterium]
MTFEECLGDTTRTLQGLAEIRPAIDAAAVLLLNTLRGGGKILTAGNGGSAAEAAHFATELAGRYAKTRQGLPAVALSADGALLSCVGNDYGFEASFARPLAALGRPGDLFVAFTSSGNSANIVAALKTARDLKIGTLSFLGRGGGQARGAADVELLVPGRRGASAQEAHLFLIHYFCELIDAEFS